MKKTLSILLACAMLLAALPAALAGAPAPSVVAQTIAYPVSLEEGAEPDREAAFLRYTPGDFKFRGNSTPVIFVLSDEAYTEDSAGEALETLGFADMVAEDSGHVLFVSPQGGEWDGEDFEVMRALAANITDNYSYDKEQQGLYDGGIVTEDGDLAPGMLYAGRTRFYVYAQGGAQDFVDTYLNTPDTYYYNTEWGTVVNGFGAGFHCVDAFEREDNLQAWQQLRRANRIVMMDGLTYLDRYYVNADRGITETIETFTTSEDTTFEYYQYLPETVDLESTEEKYPLVFVFHGSNMHPDAYAQLSNWPTMAARNDFLAVAVNGNQSDEAIIELLDWMIENYAIDESRVYATGYSMGGMKSWSLGFNHTERFAAIVPTEAIPGMGRSEIDYAAPGQILPTFYIAGEEEFYQLFPMNTEYACQLISLLAEANGFDYDGEYHEELDKYFGLAADNTYIYGKGPTVLPGQVEWTMHEMRSRDDGVAYTVLSAISDMGHSAYPAAAEHLWAFMKQFSRNEDGTIRVHTPGEALVSQEVAYPVALGDTPENQQMGMVLRYTPENFRHFGNSSPLLLVLGDAPWTGESAAAALEEMGFASMARQENGHVLFVSPVNGESWGEEDYAFLQALCANTTDDYTQGLEEEGAYDGGVNEEGVFFASRARHYVFAEGSAQAFAQEYLDRPDATYLITQWNSVVDGFGAGFYYADAFEADALAGAWEELRRDNRIIMMDGVTYPDDYYVYDDYGVAMTIRSFTTSTGATVEYYRYVPDSVDLTDTDAAYPLVLSLHGGGMHPDAHAQLTTWPVLSGENEFVVISINNHYAVGIENIVELIDSLTQTLPLDASRVYATGYSMGGVTSWNLGFLYPDRVAAIAPTEAVPNARNAIAPITNEPGAQIIPTLYVAGQDDFLDVFPADNPDIIITLEKLANTNGAQYGYDPEIDPWWGTEFDVEYTYGRYPSTDGDMGIWRLGGLRSEDGNIYTWLTDVTLLGHSVHPISAQRMWRFFTHYSRNEDGTLNTVKVPYADVAEDAWYADAVAHAYDNGLFAATQTFEPEAALTADDLAAALYNMAYAPKADSPAAWAGANGLPTGGGEISRDAFAAAKDAWLALTGAQVSDPGGLAEEITWLDNARDDDTVVTRAEAAALLAWMNMAAR